MSQNGLPVAQTGHLYDTSPWNTTALPFTPRRFEMGGRLDIKYSAEIEKAFLNSCVLCGHPILDENFDYEHPLPQWLLKYADHSSEKQSSSFGLPGVLSPTWRQLCLQSHRECNAEFAKKIENPAINPVRNLVDGKSISSNDLDRIFDWLDKVKSSSAIMGAAIGGQKIIVDYNKNSFPNYRIGLYDRIGVFIKMKKEDSENRSSLELWNCTEDGFITTPTAISLQIKDVIIVYISANHLLSETFGLGYLDYTKLMDDVVNYVEGSRKISSGFGFRECCVGEAKIYAQPMRGYNLRSGYPESSRFLNNDGSGKIYEMRGQSWALAREINLSNLRPLSTKSSYALSSLEMLEWSIRCKEWDNRFYPNTGRFYMNSYSSLVSEREVLKAFCKDLRIVENRGMV